MDSHGAARPELCSVVIEAGPLAWAHSKEGVSNTACSVLCGPSSDHHAEASMALNGSVSECEHT